MLIIKKIQNNITIKSRFNNEEIRSDLLNNKKIKLINDKYKTLEAIKSIEPKSGIKKVNPKRIKKS